METNIDLPEDAMHPAARSIDLPEHIIEEIKQHITEINGIARMKQIKTIASDIRFKYHLCQIRWVSKQFWYMMRTDRYHPRKIDTLANSQNFPSGWLPSTMRPNFDHNTWPFTECYNSFMKDSPPDFRF